MNPHQLKRLFPNASKSVLDDNSADYGDGQPSKQPGDAPVKPVAAFLPAEQGRTAEVQAEYENHPHHPPYRAEPQRPVRDEPLGPEQGEAEDAGRIVVRVVSYRRRLIDPDNLAPKYFIDALRYRCLIPGDSAKDIIYSIRQEKVLKKEEERTEITIDYP